jgi:hypothetical protein
MNCNFYILICVIIIIIIIIIIITTTVCDLFVVGEPHTATALAPRTTAVPTSCAAELVWK